MISSFSAWQRNFASSLNYCAVYSRRFCLLLLVLSGLLIVAACAHQTSLKTPSEIIAEQNKAKTKKN